MPSAPRISSDRALGADGGVAEWLKAHAWKVCIRATVSRVRIPLPPPSLPFKRLAPLQFFRFARRSAPTSTPTVLAGVGGLLRTAGNILNTAAKSLRDSRDVDGVTVAEATRRKRRGRREARGPVAPGIEELTIAGSRITRFWITSRLRVRVSTPESRDRSSSSRAIRARSSKLVKSGGASRHLPTSASERKTGSRPCRRALAGTQPRRTGCGAQRSAPGLPHSWRAASFRRSQS